jgi:hypothetical protein
METFKLTLAYTFVGDHAECRRVYEESERFKKDFKYFDWVEFSIDPVTIEPFESPAEEPADILTEDYLNVLGWHLQKIDGIHNEYTKVTGDRQERLLFSVWRDQGILAAIIHQTGESLPRGVFSGRIDSRDTFEIILNCVA